MRAGGKGLVLHDKPTPAEVDGGFSGVPRAHYPLTAPDGRPPVAERYSTRAPPTPPPGGTALRPTCASKGRRPGGCCGCRTIQRPASTSWLSPRPLCGQTRRQPQHPAQEFRHQLMGLPDSVLVDCLWDLILACMVSFVRPEM